MFSKESNFCFAFKSDFAKLSFVYSQMAIANKKTLFYTDSTLITYSFPCSVIFAKENQFKNLMNKTNGIKFA